MFRSNKTAHAVRCVILGAALTSAAAFADTGGLKVKILDTSGKPVVGAVVKASTTESLVSKKGVTDVNGFVRLIGLDPSTKYQIEVNSTGFQKLNREKVRVVSGKNFNLNLALTSTNAKVETIEVRGSIAQLDTTSTSVGLDLTLEMLDSLPTGRSYQSYLQLAPGTKPSSGGNPSSKSGVNYSDSGGAYGINVTDNNTGTFGSNFNSEIIQEQQVLTGGIPAEYAGGAGLVSRVITKSGSNEFEGSINYYLQNDSLVADNKHLDSSKYSTFDTAFTLGGPIIKDELWFFMSYQVKNREDDVADPVSGALQRSVEKDTKLGFAKLTWQATENDRLVASFFNDPTDISGSKTATTLNNRDRAQVQGGDNFHLQYSHSWDDLILTADYSNHEGELSNLAADSSTRNDVAFLGGSPTSYDLEQGGRGSDTETSRDSKEFKLTLEYYLDTNDFGSHVLKAGYSQTESSFKTSLEYTGDGAQYTSIAPVNSGVTLGSYANDSWTGTTDISDADYDRIIKKMGKSSDKAYYFDMLDTDANGTISTAELEALKFSSTSDNPTDQVNAYRINMTQTAPVEMKIEGQVFFVQDNWTYDDLAINVGLRAEKYKHISSAGDTIATFDWEIAPRISAAYDINGDGESKVFAFIGRYYDPIRTDMTGFAGNLTGPIREEQVYVGDRWLTFRTRGGDKGGQDAFFAPAIKTPYTDEILIGYNRALTDDMSIEVTYTNRVTKDIMEDYDLGLFSGDALKGSPFYLPLSYFGYDSVPDSNYVIGTLAGAKREYQGVEFTFRKRRVDNWSMLASYTYNDAQGNSNSDGNADYQGDVLELDPAAPNTWGDQPGNIKHLAKVAGTYYWDNGIEMGAVYNWNSGTLYSTTYQRGSRHFPVLVDTAYEFGGQNARWIKDGVVGANTSASYGTLDLRVKYVHNFEKYKAEFFLDIFNALDDQAVTREQDLLKGDGNYTFGQGTEWVAPRSFYLGAKVSF
jgi:hypothetical protein